MQVIAAAVPRTRVRRIGVARSALATVLMIAVGAMLAWISVGTPLISALMPSGRPSAAQMAVGVIGWGFAIVVPAGFLILGVASFVGMVERLASARPTRVTRHLARALGPDHIAATDVLLPGGERIHELVLGPFGIVVLASAPPAGVSRNAGARWEIRGEGGRWIPIEGPADRAARNAERVRGWLGSQDRDFIVKTYAVVVTDDPRVERTAACLVVPPGKLASWLEALPAQRGLTEERRERLVEMIRAVVTHRR